jgi:hypothetical protein
MNQTLFKVAVVAPVLDPGVDPKSVLCPYFKVSVEKCFFCLLTVLFSSGSPVHARGQVQVFA